MIIGEKFQTLKLKVNVGVLVSYWCSDWQISGICDFVSVSNFENELKCKIYSTRVLLIAREVCISTTVRIECSTSRQF